MKIGDKVLFKGEEKTVTKIKINHLNRIWLDNEMPEVTEISLKLIDHAVFELDNKFLVWGQQIKIL
jgi:hypothetical protein